MDRKIQISVKRKNVCVCIEGGGIKKRCLETEWTERCRQVLKENGGSGVQGLGGGRRKRYWSSHVG